MGYVKTSKITEEIPAGPYSINGKKYGREELMEFCWSKTIATDISSWERDVYLFISDFLEGKVDLIQKTSGTTGDPKSFKLNRKAMIRSAWNTINHFELHPGSKILLCLPVRYIAGRMMVVRALVGELDLLVTEPTSNPVLAADVTYDFAAMVPMQVFNLLHSGKKINSRKLIIGGGEMSPELRDMLGKLDDCEVFETFGMSETYTHFAVRHVNGPDACDVFTALQGVKLVSDDRNCLLVNIEGITKGVVQTSDLVEIVDDNSFRWLGRFDHVINSGGIKIIPEILEARIRKITGKEAILLPIQDASLGQKMVLVLEGSKDYKKEQRWRDSFNRSFQKHELPKQIYYLEEFPRNASMKVNRQQIKDRIAYSSGK